VGLHKLIKLKEEKEIKMKKFVTLLMVLLLVFSIGLTGCGGDTGAVDEPDMDMEETTMVQVDSVQGISFLLPSDLELQENNNYANMETGENVAIAPAPVDGTSMTEYTEEDIMAIYEPNYDNPVIEDYAYGLDINGNAALMAVLSLTTPGGNDVILTLVIVSDGTTDYFINYVYGADKLDGSLATNIDESIASITIQ
jgi:predicted small lipoprotein YifL